MVKVVHIYPVKCNTVAQPPGFGDFIRGSFGLLQLSKIYGYEFFMSFDKHPLSKFIIPKINLPENYTVVEFFNCGNQSFIDYIKNNKEETIYVNTNMFPISEITKDEKEYMKNILDFSPEVREKVSERLKILSDDFTVVHIRLDDDNFFKLNMNYLNLLDIIVKLTNKMNNVFITSTNKDFTLKLCEKTGFHFFNSIPVHLGDCNKDSNAIFDTIVDFSTICKSKKIYTWSNYYWISGFCSSANLIYDIPLIDIKTL